MGFMVRCLMNKDKIVIVTRPYDKVQLLRHFALLYKYNMNPQWYIKKRNGQYTQFILVRPALTDDPKLIVSSLNKLKAEGWENDTLERVLKEG